MQRRESRRGDAPESSSHSRGGDSFNFERENAMRARDEDFDQVMNSWNDSARRLEIRAYIRERFSGERGENELQAIVTNNVHRITRQNMELGGRVNDTLGALGREYRGREEHFNHLRDIRSIDRNECNRRKTSARFDLHADRVVALENMLTEMGMVFEWTR